MCGTATSARVSSARSSPTARCCAWDRCSTSCSTASSPIAPRCALLAAEVIAAGDRERVGARARAARFRRAAPRGAPASTLGRCARFVGSSRRRASARGARLRGVRAPRGSRRCRIRCIPACSTTSASRRRFASWRATRRTGTAIDIDVSARSASGAAAARAWRPCCIASRRKRSATRRRMPPRDESACQFIRRDDDGDARGARRRRRIRSRRGRGAAFRDGSHVDAGARRPARRPSRDQDRAGKRYHHLGDRPPRRPRPSWFHSKGQ